MKGEIEEDCLLTAEQVAQRLGKSVKTVKKWCEDLKFAEVVYLPGRGKGKKEPHVAESVLRVFIQERTVRRVEV